MSAVIAVVLSVDYFAQQAFAYQTYDNVVATSNGVGSLINPSEPTTINAAVAMSLAGNTNTPIWELDQNPTTSPTNKGYLFVESKQLPGNNHTSFLGYYSGKTYANSQFVSHELFASGDHAWGISNSALTFPSASDFYALSDVTDINGMYDATPMNGSGGTAYLSGTNLAIRNVALLSIAPTLTTNGSTTVLTIAPGGSYYLNPNIASDGSNAGGLFTQNYLSAYWVPIVGGSPNYSAYQYALTQNNAGNATIYGWPDPGSVIASSGASSLSMGYPGGFPGGFEQVPYSDSVGSIQVVAPSSFPSGVTGYDLVVYYGDGVERYDAQVLQVTAQSPTVTLSVTPTTSQNTGSTFTRTANTTNANGDFVQFTTRTTSGSPINNAGPGTLSGNNQ